MRSNITSGRWVRSIAIDSQSTTRSQHDTAPIEVPVDNAMMEHLKTEREAYQKRENFYKEATWRMYFRIANSRNDESRLQR